jgi:oxygen-independent coproporphyrinogen-3 oxidase
VLSDRYGIDFDRYFASELTALAPLIADGLCGWNGDRLHILLPGQLLLRTVASIFDATLHKPAPRHHAAAV